jgi:hypothetical protein
MLSSFCRVQAALEESAKHRRNDIMSVNEIVKTYYQILARQCGYWSAAHSMRKRGYTSDQCAEALRDVRHCRRVWMPTGVLGNVI